MPIKMDSKNNQSEDLRRIVARHVDVVQWNGDTADCICPGDHQHGPGGAKYATVFLSGKVPTIACFHASCTQARAEANAALRADVAQYLGAQGVDYKPTPEERAERKFCRHERELKAGARHRLLPRIKSEPPITLADWEHASPFRVRDVPVEDHWRLLLAGLYARDGVQLDEARFPGSKWANGDFIGYPSRLPYLWVGEPYEVGPENFNTRPRWLKRRTCPGPQMCPAEFNGAIRRAKENVSRRDYLVIESDDLPLEVFGNVAMYVAERMKLKLRAVVYTGGKSIHVWFDYNYLLFLGVTHQHRETLAVLRGLGCDDGMFGRASTTRMPGCERMDDDGSPTGKLQRLVFLAPKFPTKDL